MITFHETNRTTRVSNAVATGLTDIESASVDTRGYDGLCFVLSLGAVTAGATLSIKLQGSEDNVAFVDLPRSQQDLADTDDNRVFVLDTVLPLQRYVRAVVSRGTQSSAIDGIVCHQYRAETLPVEHDAATVAGSTLLVGSRLTN